MSAELAASVESVVQPVTGWRKMLRDLALVSGATGICHALGMVTSLLLRGFLSPAQMGIWQTLKLVLSYGNYMNLGASKGAARALSIARGSGDLTVATRGLNLAFTINTLSSFCYAAVLLVIGIWLLGWGEGVWAGTWGAGLMVIGLLSMLQRHVTFLVTVERARQSFAVTSQLAVLEGVLTLLTVVIAVRQWGMSGLYGGTLLVMLAAWAFLRASGAASFAWAWSPREVRGLIAVGGPMLLVGIASSLFRGLDKLLILACLPNSEHQLGCYSLALMVTAQLFGSANMLAIVLGPRLLELVGKNDHVSPAARLAARSTELQAAGLGLLGAMAMVMGGPLLAWLLPEYREGIAPMLWLIPGAAALGLAMPISQYLIARDAQWRGLAMLLAGCVLAALFNLLAIRWGYGLVGVACATSLAYGLYYLGLLRVSLWPDLSDAERWRYACAVTGYLLPGIVLAGLLEWYWPALQSDWQTWSIKTIAVLVAWSVSAWYGWRHAGWQAAWQERSAG